MAAHRLDYATPKKLSRSDSAEFAAAAFAFVAIISLLMIGSICAILLMTSRYH